MFAGSLASLRCASAAVVTLLLFVEPSRADGAAPPLERYYFKQRLSLQPDTARSAVFVRDAASREVALELAALGSDVTPFAIEGWFLVTSGEIHEAVHEVLDSVVESDVRAFTSPVFLGDDGGPVAVAPEILVGFEGSVTGQDAERILETVVPGGTILERDWAMMPGCYRVGVDTHDGLDVLRAANALAILPQVRFAEPDWIFTGHSCLIPNDPLFASLWGLHNTGQAGGTVDRDMDIPEAWDITTGSPSILVAIIDTGVQQNHPDINQVSGFDATGQAGGGGPVNSCDNHGTAVAGCVSATINNSIGVVGAAPGARSASARTFISNAACDGSWSSSASWTVDSLAWAQSIGCRVTNNSNYYGFTSAAIEQKYSDTRAAGIVHFAAAGNFSSSTISYPSSIPSVNAVAALDRNGNRAGFSNFGVGLDFSAPGVSIVSTDRTGTSGYVSGDYATVSGTSFASPYSAGVAALVLSVQPLLTAPNVESILQSTCVDLGAPGYDTGFGWGFVNAQAAVAAAQNFCVADLDGDRTVGPADLGIVLSNWQSGPAGDLTGDGQTDSADLGILLSRWGIVCP